MAITRQRNRFPTFAPWRELDEFQSRLSRMFDETLGRSLPSESSGWVPAVDVEETNESIVLSAELPGMSHDDLDIELENNVLTLRGEKAQEREEGDGDSRFHLWERSYGAFQRSFTLPRTVDADDIEAHFDNGVLRVTMPKTETAKGRRIEVQTGK